MPVTEDVRVLRPKIEQPGAVKWFFGTALVGLLIGAALLWIDRRRDVTPSRAA